MKHGVQPGEAVAFEGIEKSFFGVKVLKGVSFHLAEGSILGLVGENGAGKSTLMNVLGGNLVPDKGTMKVRGEGYAPKSPNDARAAGIAFVHQELNLFPNLNLAENLFLNSFPVFGNASKPQNKRFHWSIPLPLIHRERLHAMARVHLRAVGLEHDPRTLVQRLSAGERQLVEIAKALAAQARIIILDEPTTSLSALECERLFQLMRRFRAEGLSVIYISHALGDVLRLCDEIVVLRDGQRVGHGPTKDFSHDRLVSLMVGRQLDQLYPQRAGGDDANPPAPLPCLFEARAVTQPDIVRDVSFRLGAGEVLGISGLMGAGRSELARILFGLDPCASGEVLLQGKPLRGGPRGRIRRGMAFLTEDRRDEGLCMEASIADNIVLATLPAFTRTPARFVHFSAMKSAIHRIRSAVRLTAHASDAQAVRTLSGGNQQKVVLAKWLLGNPKVLILDEPTRGIDVGAKFEIYQLIHDLARRGAAVLVISSELEELIGICDRILVMRHGEIAREFPRNQFDRERILAAALHASKG
jgi:ribose transport system ATP-binding protein